MRLASEQSPKSASRSAGQPPAAGETPEKRTGARGLAGKVAGNTPQATTARRPGGSTASGESHGNDRSRHGRKCAHQAR
jgi:hypothetical protein